MVVGYHHFKQPPDFCCLILLFEALLSFEHLLPGILVRFVLVRCILLVGHALRNTEASESRLGLAGLAANEGKDAAGAQGFPAKMDAFSFQAKEDFRAKWREATENFRAGLVLGRVNPFSSACTFSSVLGNF